MDSDAHQVGFFSWRDYKPKDKWAIKTKSDIKIEYKKKKKIGATYITWERKSHLQNNLRLLTSGEESYLLSDTLLFWHCYV